MNTKRIRYALLKNQRNSQIYIQEAYTTFPFRTFKNYINQVRQHSFMKYCFFMNRPCLFNSILFHVFSQLCILRSDILKMFITTVNIIVLVSISTRNSCLRRHPTLSQ